MAVKNKGLGKGLNVLFGDTEPVTRREEPKNTETKAEILVKIGLVEPNRNQPRKSFDNEALKELSESIREHGVIQPIIVIRKGARYQIVAGERRYRAAKLAGLKEIPVLVREYTEEDITEVALIENLHRSDLNPIEEAEAYKKLQEDYHLTQEQVSEKVSKSREHIANTLRLLKLPEDVRELVKEGRLSFGHAKVLLGVDSENTLKIAAKEIVEKNLSVRDTERLVKAIQKTPVKKPALKHRVAYEAAEQNLSEKLKTKVQIKRKTENSGAIVIQFSSLEDFERIAEHIR